MFLTLGLNPRNLWENINIDLYKSVDSAFKQIKTRFFKVMIYRRLLEAVKAALTLICEVVPWIDRNFKEDANTEKYNFPAQTRCTLYERGIEINERQFYKGINA